jgi:hypothetical protein
MHHMRISTNKVSSMMLRSKKLEIRKKCKNYMTQHSDTTNQRIYTWMPSILTKLYGNEIENKDKI